MSFRGGLIGDYARVLVGIGILVVLYLCILAYEKTNKVWGKIKGLWQEL